MLLPHVQHGTTGSYMYKYYLVKINIRIPHCNLISILLTGATNNGVSLLSLGYLYIHLPMSRLKLPKLPIIYSTVLLDSSRDRYSYSARFKNEQYSFILLNVMMNSLNYARRSGLSRSRIAFVNSYITKWRMDYTFQINEAIMILAYSRILKSYENSFRKSIDGSLKIFDLSLAIFRTLLFISYFSNAMITLKTLIEISFCNKYAL